MPYVEPTKNTSYHPRAAPEAHIQRPRQNSAKSSRDSSPDKKKNSKSILEILIHEGKDLQAHDPNGKIIIIARISLDLDVV